MAKTLRRRRKEGKTDFKARLNLLKSGKPRLIIRKSNRYITAQIVESTVAQDKVLFGVNSNMLLDKGWPKELSGSLKSKPAAYLTGFMIGNLAKTKMKTVIVDTGLNASHPKSRVFAVVKGAIDAGLTIPHDAKSLPDDKDLNANEKLAHLIAKLKEKMK